MIIIKNKQNWKKFKKRKKISRRNLTKKKLLDKKHAKIFKIFVVILFLLFLYIPNLPENINKIIKNINNRKYKIKVCLCTLGKKENNYIREFVNHYEKYGIDKIFLYDNNDINGERFEEVINDYITKGFVEILDWRGKLYAIYRIMSDCYRRNYKNYDWLIFYELDEFIYLRNYSNIKPFLMQPKFENCQLIYLNMICHTDNNKLYYENKPLSVRFPKRVPITKWGGKKLEIKSIIRGNISYFKLENMHTLNPKLENCNGYGNRNKYRSFAPTEPDYKHYYIIHYYSKSTEEFINKLNRGDAFSTSKEYYLLRVEKYFNQSEMTKEKIDMIEKGTKLDLSKFREKLEQLNKYSL